MPAYDVIVIGAGPVGENVADRVAQGGLSVAIVERDLVGGECSYWACMPTKALLRSTAALRAASRLPGAREVITGALDPTAVLRRRDAFASQWKDDGQVSWLSQAGITLYRGQGRLIQAAPKAKAGVSAAHESGTGSGPALTAGGGVSPAHQAGAGVRAKPQAEDGGAHVSPDRLGDVRASSGAWGAVRVGGVEVVDQLGNVTVLEARHAVVVATGSGALAPDIAGLRESAPWTSREAAAADHVPGRLVIVGGGVVATEMATAFAGLGSDVTVLARDGLLPAAEPFAGEMVAAGLRESGVSVRLGSDVVAMRRDELGAVTLTLADGQVVEADEVLVAVGRTPNTADLGLDRVGLRPGDWLAVDDSLRVLGADRAPVGGLYAAGDVNRRVLLTHQGKYQARALGDAIVARATGRPVDDAPWGRHAVTADERAVPQVVFTDPEVASVGLTAAGAAAAGLRIRVVDYDLGSVAGASLHADDYRGQARMVVDEERQVIVGVTFAGPDVAELLHAGTIAVAGEVPLDRLWHAVPAYPTVSEVWLRLLEAYGRGRESD